MGNTKAAATTRKTKKKGRLSLLDLRRRNLRLQQEQHRGPSPDDDNRRGAGDHEDSEQARREKKLRPVLRLSDNPNADSAAARSELDDGRTRKVGLVRNDPQAQRQNPTPKVTDLPQDSMGCCHHIRKDTYGVFEEPVDPVEKDVFLIFSNGMQYNASNTIYHRQARVIQELAKRNFDNLRQESDDNEQEPKPAWRGRPPTKDIFKKIGRPPSVNAIDTRCSVNFSPDLSQKVLYKTTLTNLPTKTCGLHNTQAHSSSRNEDASGSAIKGRTLKYSKKSFVIFMMADQAQKDSSTSC